MASKLKKYFPIIREKEEVLAEINKSGALQEKFDKWTEKRLLFSGSVAETVQESKR